MLSFCGKNGALALAVSFFLVACGEKNGAEGAGAVAEKSTAAQRWNLPGQSDKCLFATLKPRKFAQMLRVGDFCGLDFVKIQSIVGRDTLKKTFVLVDYSKASDLETLSKMSSSGKWDDAIVLRAPLRRVVVLSSAQIGYMLRLGLQDRIVGVGDGKYIADTALYGRVERTRQGTLTDGEIPVVEVGSGTGLDMEKLIALKPDLVMTFATGGSQDDYERMEALGLPVMLTSEWQENSVDAKADWIKLFSSLFDVEIPDEKNASDSSILDPIVYGYPAGNVDPCVEQKVKWVGRNGKHGFTTVARGPRVLAGMSYGGVWYAPGGRSYTADLIRKAGGCYLWASDTTRELRLTIEEVIALADSTDLWINPGMFGTPEEILAAEPRAAHIKAFKEKHVFQNDGRKGPGGGNDFYEGAVARPRELELNLRYLFSKSYNRIKATYTIDETGVPRLDEEEQAAKKPVSERPAFEWYHNIF